MADDQTTGWGHGGGWGPEGGGKHGGMMECMMGRHIHHVIQAGDTFFNLARRYGVSTQQVVDMNPCANPENLQIGEIVCIPCPMMPHPPLG